MAAPTVSAIVRAIAANPIRTNEVGELEVVGGSLPAVRGVVMPVDDCVPGHGQSETVQW